MRTNVTTNPYSSLEKEISVLKDFAIPLREEVIVSPLMDVIQKILDLPDSLENLEDRKVNEILKSVRECQRVLRQSSVEYIKQLITQPEPSSVFKILNSAEFFRRELEDRIGTMINVEGENVEITPDTYKFLTRHKFSLGTPPITPKGIETIEELIFGGDLNDIYGFRDLLNIDKRTFDRFINQVETLLSQSTHYTTAKEKQDFQKEAIEYNNLEGLRGFKKATVTGTAETVQRIITKHLFSSHDRNSSMPVTIIEEQDKLDDSLITLMKKNPEQIFLVKFSKVPHDIFTDDKLFKKWEPVIGRLILVDTSENANKSGSTFVYSINPDITRNLAKFHVKDSGTPANTQMNLRRILENFREQDIGTLKESVKSQIAKLEKNIEGESYENARKQEWVLTAQKDYIALKKFEAFLDFIISIKNSNEEELGKIQEDLIAKVEGNTMQYFFSGLKEKGYDCISVPQGGGRRELALCGQFHIREFEKSLGKFREEKLEELKGRLKELNNLPEGTTDIENQAFQRANIQRQSQTDRINREDIGDGNLVKSIKSKISEMAFSSSAKIDDIATLLEKLDDKVNIQNLSGRLYNRVKGVLKKRELDSGAKSLERGIFRELANRLRQIDGKVHRSVQNRSNDVRDILRIIERALTPSSLDIAREMLNNIESGRDSFQPSLALSSLGWTFDDVLKEDDFPSENYIKIDISNGGELQVESLRQQLEDKKEELHFFPELFELYCEGILLIVNDPHNPTSKVMSNDVKIKLLEIASEFNLTIISDEAYHKQVSSETKDQQGDFCLAKFYEMNKSRFENGVTIHTTLPNTKWAMGGGRRTGVVLSNSVEMRNFIEENIDSVNTMSLFMDNATLETGLLVKEVCKKLEKLVAITNPQFINDPAKTIDQIIEENFSDLAAENFNWPIYTELINARNNLERIKIRTVHAADYNKHAKSYINSFIRNIKGYRLDKQTQRDSSNRSSAAIKAVERVAKDHEWLKDNYIKPDGPFYVCVKLDDQASDSSLPEFLKAIARARKIDVVPTSHGYVRFSLGGMLDGTQEGYDLLSLAIETDLRLLIDYWGKFKSLMKELNEAKDLNPEKSALKKLFPGGEIELAKTVKEKEVLLKAMEQFKGKHRRQLAFSINADASKHISRIQPDSPAHIVSINGVKCESVKDFISSPVFRDIFNNYLLDIQGNIPQIQGLSANEILANYGAHKFEEKYTSRSFENKEKEVFSAIAIEVANLWFSNNTIKILAEEFQGIDNLTNQKIIMGAEKELSKYIKEFLKSFLTEEQEQLIDYKPTFQAGYHAIKNVKPSAKIPVWAQKLISKSTFAGTTAATDMSPHMITSGTARVAGTDRGIIKRDGDGLKKPESSYFKNRLSSFVEVMDSKDYVAKVVQIGPNKILLVMNKAYSHYLVEELRLFPQFELTEENIKDLQPDGISFLGIPRKVLGADYKIGYFMDELENGQTFPVSWVNREDITDYMGYLKKPLLTLSNELMKSKGLFPIHGSALTITFKNGLRKTVVMAGDSGTGKSETIVAMVEQVVESVDSAAEVESVDLLAGDMLHMFEGADGQLYMFGTEQGDFMRTTDIPGDWIKRFRDKIDTGSRTNCVPGNPNPRITISDICNQMEFLRPVRVNMFLTINNFQEPAGSAFTETKNPYNLLSQTYVKGYRGEKGTSGDQPNIFASIFHSENAKAPEVLKKYGEELDLLLGWEVILNERGKPKDAILNFNDKPGEIERAINMVKDLFVGKSLDYDGALLNIEDIKYDVIQNQFRAVLSNGENIIVHREGVFSKIYSPIASTYCGNPFMDPIGMHKILQRFSDVMSKAGVITGEAFTQLKRDGMEFTGPAKASQALLRFFQDDRRINERFQDNKRIVNKALQEKYGNIVLSEGSIPVEIEAHNLYLLEAHESHTIRPVDENGNTIHLETPLYKYDEKATSKEFEASLITPETKAIIGDIINSEENKQINTENHSRDLMKYKTEIISWNSIEELIYQILLLDGTIQLGYGDESIKTHVNEIKKAEKIARQMNPQKPQTNNRKLFSMETPTEPSGYNNAISAQK